MASSVSRPGSISLVLIAAFAAFLLSAGFSLEEGSRWLVCAAAVVACMYWALSKYVLHRSQQEGKDIEDLLCAWSGTTIKRFPGYIGAQKILQETKHREYNVDPKRAPLHVLSFQKAHGWK